LASIRVGAISVIDKKELNEYFREKAGS